MQNRLELNENKTSSTENEDYTDKKLLESMKKTIEKLHEVNTSALNKLYKISDNFEKGKNVGEIVTDTFFHNPYIDALSAVGKASLENNWSDKVMAQYEANVGLNDEATSTWFSNSQFGAHKLHARQ
jgi:hypothetical protein